MWLWCFQPPFLGPPAVVHAEDWETLYLTAALPLEGSTKWSLDINNSYQEKWHITRVTESYNFHLTASWKFSFLEDRQTMAHEGPSYNHLGAHYSQTKMKLFSAYPILCPSYLQVLSFTKYKNASTS